MATPPLADVPAFKNWPGVTVAAGQESAAEAVLRFVSSRVRLVSTQAGGPTWLIPPEDDDDDFTLAPVPDVIAELVVSVAARVWANPDGKSSKTTGPFASSWADKITLSEDEKATIREVVGAGSNIVPGLSSVKLTAPSGTRASTLPPRIDDIERW